MPYITPHGRVSFGIAIDPSLYRVLRYLSDQERRSINNLIEHLIAEECERLDLDVDTLPELSEEPAAA